MMNIPMSFRHSASGTYGIFGEDKGTDNQIEVNANDRYTQDRWKVPHSESDNWKFERIYRINFFCLKHFPNSVRT